MYTHAKRSYTHVKDPVELDGLWNQQNNPACTENDSNGHLCGLWSLTEEEEKKD